MDTVIITGASGEPALSIARRLCSAGMRVYALAGTLPENTLSEEEFIHSPCDLTAPDAVTETVHSILEKEKHVVGIILAGQYLSDDSFECISPEEIPLTLNAQVVSPLCAVRAVLPSLIATRGHVIAISPGTGTTAGRALNAVADAATRAFAGTLFAELRDTGVKTCHILLQNNEGAPDPAARFTTSPQSRIHADIVADAVETVFKLRENNALTQMILRPQATRETPRIPVSSEPKIRALQLVQLPPPKNFPPEEEPIPTPPYRRPEYAPPPKSKHGQSDVEDDGLDDNYVDPELSYLVKQPQQNNAQKHPENRSPQSPAENAENKNKFESRNARRRRNRRNKNRNFDGAMRIKAPEMPEQTQNSAQQESVNPAQQLTPSEPKSESSAPARDVPAEPVPEKAPKAEDKPAQKVPAEKAPDPEKSTASQDSVREAQTQAAQAETAHTPKKPRPPRKPRKVREEKPSPADSAEVKAETKPRRPRPPKAPKKLSEKKEAG